MKKKLLLVLILIVLTNSLYAVDYASEYDPYSTEEPTIEKGYKNSKIISRKDLILNLSSSQVINNDCTINLDNLKLFYEMSNENKEKSF